MTTAVAKPDDYESKRKKIPFYVNFFLGASSATVAKCVSAPIERIKLVLQNQASHPKMKANPELQYTGMMNCFVRITQEEGFWSLWRGNLANVMRYIPQQAFNFAFKDIFQRH